MSTPFLAREQILAALEPLDYVYAMWAFTGALVEVLCYLCSPFRVGGDEFQIATQLGVSKMAIVCSIHHFHADLGVKFW